MAITDFDRLDISTRDGRWIMIASYGFPDAREAEMTVALLIKLAIYERQSEQADGSPRIELVSNGEPPAPVLAFLSARGVKVWVGSEAQTPAVGKPSAFGLDREGLPDLAALQRANAQAFARAHRLELPPQRSQLDALDRVIAARRRDAGEELEDGSLMVLAGAYAGEAIRAAVGGRWRFDGTIMGVQPIFLEVGPEDDKVNVLGKVRKALAFGEGDSVAALAEMVIDMVARADG